jgi:hypothetical protein
MPPPLGGGGISHNTLHSRLLRNHHPLDSLRPIVNFSSGYKRRDPARTLRNPSVWVYPKVGGVLKDHHFSTASINPASKWDLNKKIIRFCSKPFWQGKKEGDGDLIERKYP